MRAYHSVTTQYLEGNVVRKTDKGMIKKDQGIENHAINLYPDFRYQTFEGFGGCFTEAAAYTYAQMPDPVQKEFIEAYFGNEGLRYSQGRMALDSCDASLGNYAADENEEDEFLRQFSLERDEQYIIPLYRAASIAAGEPVKVMLSPWSPPAYMKTNREKNHGGQLMEKYYTRWAEYMCRYISEYRKRGIAVRRISVQNEPKAVQNWDSCVYSAKQEKNFILTSLVPAMKKHDLLSNTELYVWDHNRERVLERVQEIMDAKSAPVITGAAFHWYSGDHFESLSMLHERYPWLKLLFSEGCVEYSKFTSDPLFNARMYGHDICGSLNNGACAYIAWSILFNEEGGPNHVGNFCEAPIMYDRKTMKIKKLLSYDYIGHFSRSIVPGSVRIGMSRYTDEIDVTAFARPDGTIAVVMINRTDEDKDVALRIDGLVAELTLGSNAIMTIIIDEI